MSASKASLPRAEARTSGYRGIPWMLLTMFLFVSLDSIAKYLIEDYSVIQVVWGRYTFHMVFLLLLLRHRLPKVLVTRRLGIQLFRSLLLLVTTALFFLGLRYVPLAEASAIMFVGPIIVTVLSVPMLREAVGPYRWAGVMVGFAGALIILRPGTEMMKLGALLPLSAAFTFALYQITTRMLSHTDRPLTTLVYTALVGMAATGVAVPFFWTSLDATGWGLMFLIGLLGGVGHFTLIKAFEASEAATVTPYGYTTLIWAILSGIVVFDEYPDAWTLAGAAVIIASGLYIFHRQRLHGGA